jgi:hypothetical protein
MSTTDAAMPTERGTVTVRPRRELARGATLTGVFSLSPVLVAVLWLTLPTGHQSGVLAVTCGVVVMGLLMYWRYRLSYAAVTRTEFVKRGWLPGFVRLRRDEIDSLVLVRTYRDHSTETVTQLLALDDERRRLFRMRGTYWSEASVEAVVDALGIPTTVLPRPLTRREFFAAYPDSPYWYESRPWIGVTVAGTLFALATGTLVVLFQAFGSGA